MQVGSVATGDGTTLTTTLSDYDGKISGLASSWKGTSYDSFNSQTTAFVSEYKPIADQLNSFGSACDNYIEYENKRNILKQREADLEKEQAKPDDEQDKVYIHNLINYISQLKSDIEILKTQITSDLSTAGSTKLEATALSASVSSSVASAYETTSTDTSTATGDSASGTPGTVSASEYAIEPHSRISESERNKRIAMLGGTDSSNMTKIEVPYWDGTQEKTMSLTVNKNIAQNYQNAFREIADMKWTINPDVTAAYNYRTTRNSGRLSDHAYGSAIDVNWDHNFDTGDGSSAAVRGNEAVIEAFAKQGFYWGGDWKSSKDDMHFTFTGW